MNVEYKKLYRNYFIMAIVIIVLLFLVFFGTKYISKQHNLVVQEASKNIKNNYSNEFDKQVQIQNSYAYLKNELDSLSGELNNYAKFDEYDYSMRLRYCYNKAAIYDRELGRINSIISDKIPRELRSKYFADDDSFRKQREDNCKKMNYGIEDAHLANILYYDNFSSLTLNRCYDVLDEYKYYLDK